MTPSRDLVTAKPGQEPIAGQTIQLGAIQTSFERRVAEWSAKGFYRALWAKDYRLWPQRPVPEISNRMGWLTLPEGMQDQAGDISYFADMVRDEGFRHVVLLGMGGSSLAPDEPAADLAVPENGFTFGGLIRAQALGDYQALARDGRRVLRVNLGGDVSGGIAQLRRAFETFFDGATHA